METLRILKLINSILKALNCHLCTVEVKIMKLKVPSTNCLFFRAIVRHTPLFSSQLLYHYPHSTSYNLYPTNPALHTQHTTLKNFLETPPDDVFQKFLSPLLRGGVRDGCSPSPSQYTTMTILRASSITFGLWISPRGGLAEKHGDTPPAHGGLLRGASLLLTST